MNRGRPESDVEGYSHILVRVAQGLIAMMLFIAPFPFGSVEDRSIFAMEMLIVLLMAIWIAVQILRGEFGIVESPWTFPLIGLLSYLVLTLAPLPGGILQILSPETYSSYQAAGRMLGKLGETGALISRLTLTPFDTGGEVLKIAGYALFFLLCVQFLRFRHGHMASVYALIVSGSIVAFEGILQSVWSNGKIYWVVESGSGTPFGPFANHNHFAGYLELTLGLTLGMLTIEIHRFREKTLFPGIRGYLAWIWDRNGSRVWLILVAAFLMVAAVAASLSRGGVLSVVGTAVLFGLFFLFRRRRTPGARDGRRRKTVLAGGLVLMLALLAALSLSPRVRDRWNTLSGTRYRFDIWMETLRGIQDYPITGAGLGSFRTVLPRYKASLLGSETTHAENEYLEWMFETGIAGSALMLIAVLTTAGHIVSRLKNCDDAVARGVVLGGLFSLVSLSIHHLSDFNMHIPSNALTAVAIAAICLLSANRRGEWAGDLSRLEVYRLRLAASPGIAAILILTALTALIGYRSLARFQSARLREEAVAAERTAPRDAPIRERLELLDRSLAWSGSNDYALFSRAATCATAAGGKGFLQSAERRNLLEQAGWNIREAIRRSPASAVYWAELGRIEGMDRRFDAAQDAYQRAILLGRTYGYIHSDYGRVLILAGNARAAAAQFLIARTCHPGISLREMLELLSSGTPDESIWRAVLRHDPDDLKIYAQFLMDHGLFELSGQASKEAGYLREMRPKF